MLRLYISSFLLVVLVAVSCGQKKKNVSERFAGLIPEPPKTGRLVNDFGRLFSASESNELERISVEHNKATTNQVAIITFQMNTARVYTDEGFDSLTLEWANYWGIGAKGKNNGVALFIELNQRRIRLHVGYGLEEKLTNAESKKIIDDIMLPSFKKGEFFIGTQAALEAVINEIK